MKNNKIKTTLLMVLVLLFGMTIRPKADQIIQYWKGEKNVQSSMLNLDEFYQIPKIIAELKKNNSEYLEDIEYLDKYNNELVETIKTYEKLISERDESIKELHNDIKERDNVILVQINVIDDLEAQLEQAYKDVVMVDNKIAKVLDDVISEIKE